MEELMKTEWLAIINRKRNGTYPEWTSEPLPLNNASIERRGFKAYQTNVVKL